MDEHEQLAQAIAALESQRALLGDAVVDAALAPMREKLAALASRRVNAGQQRKFVTVLFADVVGSTQLGQHLDPENIMTIIDGAMRRFTTVIEQHGGQVRSYQGDGFLALFGYPVTREDDAERAIRAGLALLAESQAYAPQIAAQWGYGGFNIRVGINSGGVILGGGVDRDTNALGMATNIAARMQNAAPPGGVLITHDTYRQVRGVFDVEPQPPLKVKGSDEPLRTYLVLRAKPRAFHMATRGVEGVETRLIGREGELSALQDAYRDAIVESKTRVITITGEAGVGKSRLLDEFGNWIELRPERVHYLMGRAVSGGQAIPYALVRDMLAYRFEILESDSAATALARFRRGMAGLLEPEKADLVGQLAGFDFRSASPYVAALLGSDSFAPLGRTYFTHYMRGLVARHPVVIFLEDLHWADDSSLDLMAHALAEIGPARLLVAGLTRPQFFERRSGWDERQEGRERIDLQPLAREASQELVEEILKNVPQLPISLRDLVVESAEGNPYYAEELVKMLIDDGVIVTGHDPVKPRRSAWQVDLTRLTKERVPSTLAGILQARLDALPAEEKVVLQRASVVGRIFWDRLVVELAADAVAPEQVPRLLASSHDRELVFRREQSRLARAEEYIFKHAILTDVTYETVLLRLRARYHAQVAAWLEAHAGERMGEHLRLIAGHYEQAGDALKAVAYLKRAGEEALKVSAYRDAREAFEDALRLLEPAPPAQNRPVAQAPAPKPPIDAGEGLALHAAVLIDLGQALIRLGEYGQAAVRLSEGLPHARQAGDRTAEIAALDALGEIGYRQGDNTSAQTHLEQALVLARRYGDRASMALVTRDLGRAARIRGEGDEAVRWAEQSRAVCDEIGDRQGAAAALNILAAVATDRRDFMGASRYLAESLALCRETGDRMGAARVLNNLGVVASRQEAHAEARGYFEQYQAIAAETGDRWGAAVALVNIGETYLEEEQDEAAWHNLGLGLQASWAIQDLTGCLLVLADIARLLIRKGQLVRAAELLGLALNHPASYGEIELAGQPALVALHEKLPAGEIEAALRHGRALNMEQVVAEIR